MSASGPNGKKATRPCPCGHGDDPERECACDEPALRRYRARVSGPLLDRIDLRVPVPRVPWRDLAASPASREPSAAVRARVLAARERQARRYADRPFSTNAELPPPSPNAPLPVEPAALLLLERAVTKLGLSVRAWVRTLRVARTIADLDPEAPDDGPLAARHVAQALGFRGDR